MMLQHMSNAGIVRLSRQQSAHVFFFASWLNSMPVAGTVVEPLCRQAIWKLVSSSFLVLRLVGTVIQLLSSESWTDLDNC